ncbi:hypothetical protein [Lactiplantibacillus fabifermentans]|uniref:Uncharacterized protein n=2 Tax=Lactiplantibacillus fabifermentans TaxID=483011 RepID=A0A0R2NSN9_9LACO|nr:hypothetical protein [Lactiplantibacillus fabifermentans]ETY74571.1 hypothetical protein LFAB_06585 [Lactiplantibacillus fabifermentans T30PCM01]KRO27890.1 hypothetical protein DY78_GL002792 [Lactiplantibacillus fabifermentans DSM 21115]
MFKAYAELKLQKTIKELEEQRIARELAENPALQADVAARHVKLRERNTQKRQLDAKQTKQA